MATPAEMRALATTLEEIAPYVDTDYGLGQVATYGLAWEALRSGADEIERLNRHLDWIGTQAPHSETADSLRAHARLARSDSAPGAADG